MILTHTLAQQLVDNIMPIARHNINIMDSQGIIIGSGQPHRLNNFHQGALDVISSGQTVEIFPTDMPQYSGSFPGLNMPISLSGQLIGVVGITGHPDEVRDIARMVKMVTEVIVEQEVLLEEARSQHQLKESFATALLSDTAAANQQKLMKTAKLLKFDLNLPRLVTLIDTQPVLSTAFEAYGHNDLVAARARETILQTLQGTPLITAQDLLVFIEEKLLLFKHFPPSAAAADHQDWGRQIVTLLTGSDTETVSLGLGSLAANYTELSHSYQEAQFALSYAQRNNPLATIHDFDVLAAYLVEIINKSKNCQPLETIKTRLKPPLARKYDMRNTILCLLKNNLNITSTAKHLYIHRNTLLFRLEKLREATSLDPCRYLNHAIICKIIFEE